MENLEIARTLSELADLLEIDGANPFRIRAYRTAVETVNGLTRALKDMVAAGDDLTALPGVGKDIAASVQEMVTTGRLGRLVELGEKIPRDLVLLTRLDGVGPKKAKRLWEELDVRTMDQLEVAVQDGRVAALSGFGVKSSDRIVRAIADFRNQIGRVLLSEADQLLVPLLEYMREAPGVERVEVAGSYRRRKETIGDLDLLALHDGDGSAVVDHFVAFPAVERITGQGDTKGSVVLRSGLAVDLRVIPRQSFGAALQYFTGSKEHNVQIRIAGVRRRIRINEWGVFRIPEGVDPETLAKDAGERLGGETEEEMYAALDLPWIEPVLRENRGEIQAAQAGRLPKLVSVSDIRGELHLHSTWSDGKRSIQEMVDAVRERGFDYLAVTDHTPAVGVAGGLTPPQVLEQWLEIDRIRKANPDMTIFRGLEVDILRDGSLDTTDEVLEGLDLVIVSVHGFMDLDRTEMTDRVIRALDHPAVDILGHPSGRKLNRREPFAIDMEAVLQAAVAFDVAVEVNASPRRLDLNDVHVKRAGELGLRIAINTDAHSERDLENLSYGVDQARRGWVGPEQVLNTLSADGLRTWLGRRDG